MQQSNPWKRPDAPQQPRPTKLSAMFIEKDQAVRDQSAEAERQRIASMTPFDIWYSTLDRVKQKEIDTWEMLHPGLAYPMPSQSQTVLNDAGQHRSVQALSLEEFLQPKADE